MIALRKFFFYWFLLIYIILCPLIIFYALGYIFSPHMERGVIKTGMIHVQSLPSKATVTVGQKRSLDLTPMTVGDLMPGSYELSVAFPGYKTWLKTVSVEAGKATVLDQVLLIPANLPEVVLLAVNFNSIEVLPGTHYLMVSSGNQLGQFQLFDWNDASTRPLLEEDSPYRKDSVIARTVVPESKRMMIEVERDGERHFLWHIIENRKTEVRDITKLLANISDPHLFWDPDDDDYLFCYSDHSLSLFNLKEMAIFPNFSDHVYGYGVSQGKLYALKDSAVVTMDISGKPRTMTVMEDADFIRGLFDPANEYTIHGVADDLTVLLGQKGEFLTNRLPYRFADEGIRGFSFLKKPEKLLIWKKGSLGILDMSKTKAKRRFFELGLKVEWIFQNGKSIEQAFWANDGSHILFQDQNQIYLMDVGSGYDNQPERILTVKPGSSFFYTDETGKIYYLDASTGYLMSAQILPDERFLARKIAMAIEAKTSEFEKMEVEKVEPR